MNRILVILIHIGYWMMYLLLLLVMFALLSLTQRELFANFSTEVWKWLKVMTPIAIIPGIIGFYGGYTWLFRSYLARKKLLLFFLFALLVVVVSAIISVLIMNFLFPDSRVEFMSANDVLILGFIISVMASINLVIGIVIKGFITAYGDIQVKEELTRHSTNVELALVKSQINPHFLFNTLNNIDVLIRRNPEDASNYLNKLSEILRFMLYEAKDEPMPFNIEYENIMRYVELQRIRTSIDDYVKVEIHGQHNDLMLEPMIFLPIIENAFKHAEHRKEKEAIKILWNIDANKIVFRCENNFSHKMNSHHAAGDGGIGNELIRKRLQLLYPGRHAFSAEAQGERFVVELIIERK